MEESCIFEECDRGGKLVKGLCHGHYRQQHRGQPLTPLKWKRSNPERNEKGKKCNACKECKPYEEYHVSARTLDGRQGKCITCQRATVSENYQKRRRNKSSGLSGTTESTSGSLSSV